MASEKIIDRIEKLLRLAASDSGASLNEREMASVEAVRLIVEHRVTLHPPAEPTAPTSGVRGAWVLNVAPYHCGCDSCGRLISPRDEVWIKVVNHQYYFRHNYGTCAVA